jgi:rare lipoprotein A
MPSPVSSFSARFSFLPLQGVVVRRTAIITALFLMGHVAATTSIEAHGVAEAPAVDLPLNDTEWHSERPLDQIGIASHYGRWHRGRHTASGERFDDRKLTAAHPTLPLGTRIRVTNINNGRSVDVRINDRGPYVKGRILDLSSRAAKEIGIAKEGVAPVRIEIVAQVGTD